MRRLLSISLDKTYGDLVIVYDSHFYFVTRYLVKTGLEAKLNKPIRGNEDNNLISVCTKPHSVFVLSPRLGTK